MHLHNVQGRSCQILWKLDGCTHENQRQKALPGGGNGYPTSTLQSVPSAVVMPMINLNGRYDPTNYPKPREAKKASIYPYGLSNTEVTGVTTVEAMPLPQLAWLQEPFVLVNQYVKEKLI